MEPSAMSHQPQSLSLTGRRWFLRNTAPLPADASIATLIARTRNMDPFSDHARRLSDPFLFPEMQKAVDRIQSAIEKKETIGIFGDYDADGITAALQVTRALKRRGIEPVVHLPDRVTEGYGLKKKSIDTLHARGVTLLITVDTGIAAQSELEHASSLGIDVIVTDHHRPQGGRPPAYVVLHPTVPAPFPNEHLCGAGVAFMLVRALEGGGTWDGVDEDIVLAMIGTVGDLVPLTGENRTLVIHGLQCIPSLAPSPLKSLIDTATKPGSLTSGDIAFRIVPRLNAAGRMAHPDLAFRALFEGGESLEKLHALNSERQIFIRELTEDLLGTVDTSTPFLFVASEKFTPGTIGLVAGKLTEKTGKPSLAAAPRGSEWTASLRSPDSVDVMRCLGDSSVLPFLITHGGHAQAAGCTYEKKNESALRDALVRSMAFVAPGAELLPTLNVDYEMLPGNIPMSSVKDLLTLEPFGMKNEEPKFLLKSRTLSDCRTVGADGAHLQCRIGDMKAIGFGFGSHAQAVSSSPHDFLCKLGVNVWNGQESVQVFIEDIREVKRGK